MKHGTLTGYTSQGCRCAECRRAHTIYQRRRAVRRRAALATQPDLPLPHGNTSTYGNWGCRCDPCTAANSERMKAYRARRSA